MDCLQGSRLAGVVEAPVQSKDFTNLSIMGRKLYQVTKFKIVALIWIYSYELFDFLLHFPEYEFILRVCSKSGWCCYLAQDYLSFSLPLQEARIRFDDLMSLSRVMLERTRRRLES